MQTASSTTLSDPAAATRGVLTGWPMVAVFSVYAFISFVDREVITLIVEPLQRDLDLTDFQVSLLLGPAFGVFYALAGLPMGWLLDRYSRRWITASAVAFWGLATTLSGASSHFFQLFLTRMGIGLGESALSPAAHSMISEQMPREKLSTTLSVYTAGAYIGGGFAVAAGAWLVHAISQLDSISVPLLGEIRPWQFVFLIVGLPTILMAPVALLLKEADPKSRVHATTAAAAGPTFGQLLRQQWLLFLGLPFGFAATNVLVCAYKAWTPTYLIRTFEWDVAAAGMAFGIQQAVAGVLGLILSGWIVDRLYGGGMKDAHVRWHLLTLVISCPTMVWALNSGSPWLFLALSTPFWLLAYSYVGYAAAALQIFAPSHLRGRIAALFIAFLAIVGAGIGPPLTGWFTDAVFHDKAKLGLSLTAVTVIWGPIALAVLWAVGRELKRLHAERGM